MNQMNREEIYEAKHFDITLRFVRDLEQFVKANDEFLNKGKSSELNVKVNGDSSRRKKIRKSAKDDMTSSTN